MKISYKKDTFYLLSVIFIITFFVKFFQFSYLPSKYFYDSNFILTLMNNNYVADKSYNFTAKFFDLINIFSFASLQEWAIFISLMMTTLIFIILIKNYKYTFLQYIFIYASFVLLNIYVFNLSKDIIQFLFFLILFFIIRSNKISNKRKLICSTIILMYEALFFRVYYAIMAMLLWTIYIIYLLFIRNKNIEKKKIYKIIILALFFFFVEVFVVQIISYENYNSIINARSSVNIYREDSLDAVTIINDILGPNTNYLIFVGNYIINTTRLMFPLELLTKSIKYIPFVVYQLFISYNIIKVGKKINDNNIILIIIVISFMMISIIFEPDFGSFIRHESALILFLLEINRINSVENFELND